MRFHKYGAGQLIEKAAFVPGEQTLARNGSAGYLCFLVCLFICFSALHVLLLFSPILSAGYAQTPRIHSPDTHNIPAPPAKDSAAGSGHMVRLQAQKVTARRQRQNYLTEPKLFLRSAKLDAAPPVGAALHDMGDAADNNSDSTIAGKKIGDTGAIGGNAKDGETAAHHSPVVALTLDICGGTADRRIFDVLLQRKIAATLFITGRFLRNKANADIIAQIRAHPQLFEIGNHGDNHIPAVDNTASVYGLKTAGSLAAICKEAAGGLQAIEEAGLNAHVSRYFWYRDASALYSANALRFLQKAGFSIAGFSWNIDKGASVSAEEALRRSLIAKDGDVLIAHMNQPARPAGKGVAAGITALQQKGYRFIQLSRFAAAGKQPQIIIPRANVRGDLYSGEELSLRASQAVLGKSYPNCAVLLQH